MKPSWKTGKRRLLKLAAHLETGKLGHEVFDFSTYNGRYSIGPHCRTRGCAIGECPIVWPFYWRFSRRGQPCNRLGQETLTEIYTEHFFSLRNYDEEYGLFAPGDDSTPWNTRRLTRSATKEQVAAGVRRYIAWRDIQSPST